MSLDGGLELPARAGGGLGGGADLATDGDGGVGAIAAVAAWDAPGRGVDKVSVECKGIWETWVSLGSLGSPPDALEAGSWTKSEGCLSS